MHPALDGQERDVPFLALRQKDCFQDEEYRDEPFPVTRQRGCFQDEEYRLMKALLREALKGSPRPALEPQGLSSPGLGFLETLQGLGPVLAWQRAWVQASLLQERERCLLWRTQL